MAHSHTADHHLSEDVTLTLAEALALALKQLGVNFVFGVSGANIEHFHDAIYRIGGNELSNILAKGECAAAWMADGYARTQHTLGVCCATSGAGMINLAGGIAEAYADGVPLLGIVGQVPQKFEGKGAFQDSSGLSDTVDAMMLWQSITKYVAKIVDASQFWNYFQRALNTIYRGNPGPSVLLIPSNLFTQRVPSQPLDFSTSLANYREHQYPSCSPEKIDQLLDWLTTAKNPLIIIGKYAKYYPLDPLILRFVEQFHCAVVTTLADVNAFRQNHPRYLGMIGICGHPHANDYLHHHADLIVVIEDDLSVMTTTSVYEALNRCPLVYVGIDASKARHTLEIELVIEAKVTDCLAVCLKKVTHRTMPNQSTTVSHDLSNTTPSTPNSPYHLTVQQAAGVIEPYLCQTKQVFFDAGNCVSLALYHLKFPTQVKTLIALGMGGMGYAIPAAIGAQLGSQDGGKTMVISGDGGFLITGMEIHTAVDYQLPILFVIFNNNQHGMCVTRQQLYFNNRITAATYSQVNIAQLIQGVGNKKKLWTACVEDRESLQDVLYDYYSYHSGKTGVLEIKMAINEMPPFQPFLAKVKELEQSQA